MSEYAERFARPERRYAIYPIVHGAIATDPGRADWYARCGFAGVVGNVPYGPGFPHDAAEWEATRAGFEAFMERGMETWIYDEKGYPSGTAGGYVVEQHPEFVAQGLYCYDYWRVIEGPGRFRADTPGDRLFRALLVPADGGDPLDVTHFERAPGTLYIELPAGRYRLFTLSIRRLFDGTHATESYSEPRNYISLSDREATRAFIEVTHERYAALLGERFGRGVRAFFTDEPSLISWNIRAGVFPILPWHPTYPEQFAARYGYPFEYACVAAVLKTGDHWLRRRCDLWEFIADSVANGFFGTIQQWCRAHGIKASGHMLEEERLQAHVYNYGSLYRCGRRFDWPGIDQLHTDPAALMDPQAIPIARLLASLADISGERESFTEFSDHTLRMQGAEAPPAYYYASVNWHMAMGINNLTSYYSFRGFSEGDLVALNAYAARTGYLLRQGVRDSRVALLYPEATMWAVYTPNTNVRAIDQSPETLALDATFARASWELLHRQVDFDYVDAELIEAAALADGALRVGDRAYECVVLPGAWVLPEATLAKLSAFAAAGGTVIVFGEAPRVARETGEPFGPEVRERLAALQATGRFVVAGADAASAAFDGPALPRPLTFADDGGRTVHPLLLTHVRRTEDGGRIVYLANMDEHAPLAGTLRVAGRFVAAEQADPTTGAIGAVALERTAAGASVAVDLPPLAARFYLFAAAGGPP